MISPTTPEGVSLNDTQEVEDFLTDAISESLGPDWSCRDGAKFILMEMEREGLTLAKRGELYAALKACANELEQAQHEIARLRETAEWLPNIQDEHCDQKVAYLLADARAALSSAQRGRL